ncbi:MAG: sensor histidine kinase [Gemmatimonadales bacterium]
MEAPEQRREVLRQASVALRGRVVTLWEISPDTEAVPLLSGTLDPPAAETTLDLDATLRQWGAPIIQRSRWVGCRTDSGRGWCVAPVRARPAAPPPEGVERRSQERLILELAGLGIGALDASDGAEHRRLAPADALWELARQPSVIAHEAGNPLAVALGNLDLSVDALRGADALDPSFRAQILDDLSNVAEGIEQAAGYLRSIQDRPEGSVGRLARFDVLPIVRSCVTLERPLARKRGVVLKWDSALESIYVYGDSAALYQVITNLIRNAVDASRGPDSVVLVTVDQVDALLHLSVHDQGAGIPPEHRPQLFRRGFTTKASGKGSGIGLAVVKEITQNMFGGSVQVETEVGSGSTFTLVLPIPPQRRGWSGSR